MLRDNRPGYFTMINSDGANIEIASEVGESNVCALKSFNLYPNDHGADAGGMTYSFLRSFGLSRRRATIPALVPSRSWYVCVGSGHGAMAESP